MNESSSPTSALGLRAAPDGARLIQPNLSGHLPVLDGIRGIAILLVLIYHQTNMAAVLPFDRIFARVTSFGWMGVDLFFVLSGFLITGILYDAKGTDLYFRNFYARRTLRIFPLYYGVILLYLVILPRVAPHFTEAYGEVAGKGRWYWAYLSNFSLALFTPNERGVLNSTWSLAIEEQFYLIWPTVVFFFNRQTLQRICGFMMLAALATRVVLYLNHVNGMVIYALTPCRMDALAAGAFVALASRGSGGAVALVPWARRIALVLGGFLTVWIGIHCLYRIESDPVMMSAGFSSLALVFASLLLLSITCAPSRLPSRFLSQAWLRSFGRYSYALYLLHTPLQEYLAGRVYPPSKYLSIHGSVLPGQFLFYVLANGATFVLAILSWNLFEKHFLKLKRFFPMGRKKLAAGDGPREGRPSRTTAAGAEAAPAGTY